MTSLTIKSFFSVAEIDSSEFMVSQLFKRKFGHTSPDFPRHFAAFYRDSAGALHLAGYSHMRRFDEVYLSGGSCSDGEVIRLMSPEERAILHSNGGVWFQILKYKFAKLGSECEAFFGHCGDARAMVVALQAGFVQLNYRYLIAHWHKPLSEQRKEFLTEKVNGIGPF